MFRRIRLLLVLALVVAGRSTKSAAQAPPPPLPSVTLPADLDRVLRDYERHWVAGDAAGLAALFAEDGFVLQPGRPPVRGRANIAEAYRGAGGGPLALRALAFATDGSVGYILGAYAAAPGNPDIGKFTLVLRRTGGGPWQIVSDMDNGNQGR